MRGMDIILKRSPVNVVPIALKGMWGSYFSRHKGAACQVCPRAGPRLKLKWAAYQPEKVTAEETAKAVAQLRGSWR